VAWNSATNTPVGCGDPNFFTPVLTQFAGIVNKQGPPVPTPANAGPSPGSSPTAGDAFNAGLQQIPGLTPTQKSQITAGLASPPAPPPSGNSLSAPGANQLPAMPTAIQPAQSKGGPSLWPIIILAAILIALAAAALEALRRYRKARAA
jgi:hypothetical protein